MAKKNVEERFNAALEQYRNPQDTIDNSRAVAFARQVESFSNDLSSGKLNYDQIEEKQKQLSAQADGLAKWASQNRNSLNASFEGIGKALGVWNDISSSIDEYRSSPLPNYGWNREAPEAIQAMQTGTIGETPDVIALRDAASRLALGGADPAFKPYEDFYKMKNTPLDVAVGRADDFKRLAEYQSRANGLDGNTRYSGLTREEFQDYTALMDKYHLDVDSLRNMPLDKMAAGYAQQAVQSKQYNTNEEMTAAARSDKDFERLSATGLKMMESGGALGDYNDRMSVGNSYDTQLKYMTDEQKAIYAYYLAKGAAWQPDGSGSLSYDERRKEADRYYHTIAEDIAYRAAQDAVKERHQPGAIDWATVLNSGNPVGMLMNSARITNMAIAQLRGAQGGNENASAQALEAAEKVDYLGDLFNTSVGNAFQNIGAGFVTLFGGKNNEDYYTPTPSNLDIQRGLLYEKYTGDSKVRKVVADLVMNTGNMAPQILATTIATLATGGMAAAGGAAALAAHGINTAASIATMGMQVYGESYDEGRRMGMDTNQAGVYGLLNAGSELALGEIMGIAGRAGGTVLSRGLQRIAPNIDNAVTAVASKVGKTAWGRYLANVAGEGLEEYMQDVLEPWFRALATGGESENLDFLSADALYSGLIGMLSAGFMDINGVVDVGQEITLYKDAGAQIKSAGTVGQLKSIASTFSADTKAYQLAEKLTEDSKPSEIGKVLKAVGAALSDQNVASMSAYLQEKYKLPKGSADKLIGFFRDYCNGADLSDEGLDLLDVNDEITEAFLAEIVDVNVSDARRNAALQALAQNVNFGKDMARPEQEFNRRNIDFKRFIADTMLGKSSADTQSAASGESSVSKPAAEYVRALFNERGNLNAIAIDTLVSAYEAAGAKQDVVSYVQDAEQAYIYGKYDMDLETETKWHKLTLTTAQTLQAYRLGKLFSGKEFSTAIAKVKQRVSNETQAERGAVRFEYDTQRTKLTDREQTSVDFLSSLAHAYNLKLSFFESTLEDGKRVYKTQDGKTVSTPNGYYTSSDGTIHIDVHAGQAGQGVVMYTAAHELTHYIRDWSPNKFKVLANFLVKQYGKAGKSVDYYVRAQMQKAKNNKKELSYDEAFDEFVADSMETMLADGRVAEKLRALKEQDKTLWQKVKDFFKDFAANLKKLVEQYKDVAPDSEEGKFVASLNRDVIEKLEDLFTEGVVGASENFSRANVEGGKEVVPIEAGEPASPAQEVKFSIRLDEQLMEDAQKAAEKNGFPFDYEEVRIVRNALVDMLNGVEWTDAKGRKHKAITGLNLPADKISTEYAGERSAPGNRKKIKKGDFVLFGNASYGRSAENTSVCIRSIMNDAIVEQVELALGRKLSITESLYVTQQIANYTDIPQCVYCYVAADRAAYNQMLGQFLNDRPKVIQAQQEGKTLAEAIRMISKTSKPTAAEINRATLWYNAARDGNVDLLTKESDYAGVMYSSESEAKYRAKLKNSLARQEYDLAVRYASSASHAKKRVGYTAYDGAIADPKIMPQKLVDTLNSEYGLRMYSYSDFSPAFILENVQMITDAAARGLKMLAYTKELDFVKLFAPTGMNINISVFGMQNPDADGNFHQDAMWGADWAEAQKLRSQYDNVGCTFVATSDAQVAWAMQQDWIDVVIPYHSVFAGGTTVGRYFGYTDYKSVQADAKSAEHRSEDAASVYPPEHQNDIVKYVEALGAHHLQPRFAKWITGWREYLSSERTEADKQALRDANPYYMKLVNETRRSAAETPVVKPEFGGDFLTVAGESLQTMARKGGYAPPFAQDIEEQTEFAKEIAGRIEKGEALDHDVMNPKPERTEIRVDDAYAALGREGIRLSDRDAFPDTDYAAEVKRMQEEEYSKLKAAYEKLLREASVKDTLRSENAALRERVAGLQETLKGITAPALNPEDVRKYVRSLKKTYMSDVDSTELAVGISKLWHMMADLDAPVSWDALYAQATELGRRVIEGASLHALNADPRLTAMQAAYDYFSGNPKGKRKVLKISPENAAEFGYMQGTGKSGKRVNTQEWSDTRKVFAAHGINLIVGTGNTLDDNWYEAAGLFPEFFENDIPSQDELRAVMGFLNEYDFIRDQKAVEVLGGEDIDNMAAWVANNIMDTLNPGLDENGNAKKDAIRQSKSLMQQSEQEMYRQISMHQTRLNRVYNREIKRLTAENTATKQQVKDLGAKIKANARTYSAEISRRDVQLRDQIIQYEKEIDQLTRRKDAELESSQRAHGDDIVRYEKAIERLNEKIAAAKQQQNELRQQKNAQIEELRKQKNAEKREAVQKVKESYSRKQQSQQISDVLARIADRLVGAKKKPQTKQGVKSLAETVLTQAEDFFKGNSGADAKTMLNGIANAYADTENAGASYIEGAFRQEVHDNLTELANDLAGKSAKDLTAAEMHDIYKALRAVEVSINRAGYLFGMEAAHRVEDSAAKVILEIENQKQAKAVPKAFRSAATAAAYMYWADLKPIYAMRSINSTELSRLFNAMLYDGQAVWTKDVDRGREAMLNASQKHGFSKWNFRETHEFTDKYGEKISLNLEQMMYLYACVRRGEQAVNHLTNGGFVFGAPVESKKGKLTYMVRDARAHALTVEELIKIRDTLTDSQRMFVEELQDYLSTVCAADGNGVSMELYGIDMFGEPNYIPLMSAGNFHSKAGEVQFEKEFGVGQKLTGRSFTKRTVKNANNPILLQDFTDVVRGHISDMAQYHAFAVPLTNFQKVFSWAEKQTDSGNRKSVRSALENRFGSDAPVRYLNILLNDLNNSARRDPTETLFDRGLSVFKRSAVAFSLSVAIQQPSAIARTLYVLNPRYFAGAKVERAKAGKTWEQLRQYSSTARLKDIGGFDVGMKGSTEDYIFHRSGNVKDTLENGLHTASGVLPEAMDKITWCTIWNAVKREVRHKNPGLTVDSEAFLSAAGRRFDEIVNLTQVYDSTLTRSQAMRSRTTYMKSITAFMAEPTTGLNMLLDGLRRGGKAGAAAVGAWTASAVLNAVLASVIYAGRDDDEDKTYLEKYLKSLSNEVLDGLNPLTAIPLVQDIWNLIQGWDVDRADLSVLADIITNVKRAASKILKGDELAWKDYENSIGLILQAFGIPAKNISRDVRAVFQTVLSRPVSETQWYEILSGVLPAIFPDERGSKLYYAVTSGNSDYLERLKSGYKDEVSYHSAIRAALREQDPRIAAAAEAYRDNDIAEYKRLVSAVKADGFIQDDVVSAVISTYNELIKTGDERSYTEGKVSMYTTEHYVTSLAQGLGMENEIFDELVRAYQVKNADKGYTQEEAETNVRKSIMSAVKEAYVETGVLDREKTLEALKSWMDADKAEDTLKQWDYSKSVGAEWDDRYSTYYEAITDGTGDASKIKAEILMAGVEEKDIQQKVVDRVEDDYSSGRMTAAEAQNLLKQYGGLEAEEAQTKINVWDYMGRHPDSALQADDIALFFTKYRELGVPESNFEDYLLDVRACKGVDKDGDGRAENGTKKAQVMEVIDALPVSSEVKDALYFEEGYKASKLYEAPWR